MLIAQDTWSISVINLPGLLTQENRCSKIQSLYTPWHLKIHIYSCPINMHVYAHPCTLCVYSVGVAKQSCNKLFKRKAVVKTFACLMIT